MVIAVVCSCLLLLVVLFFDWIYVLLVPTYGEIRWYGKQLFTALQHLHTTGFIHADLKPDNVVVGGRQRHDIKVGDMASLQALLAYP